MHISHPHVFPFLTALCLLNLCIASPLISPPTLQLTSATKTNITAPPDDYHPVIRVPGAPIILHMLDWGYQFLRAEIGDSIRDELRAIDDDVRQHGNDAIPDRRFVYSYTGRRTLRRIILDFMSDTMIAEAGELTWQDLQWALNGFLHFVEVFPLDWACREWDFDIEKRGVRDVGGRDVGNGKSPLF